MNKRDWILYGIYWSLLVVGSLIGLSIHQANRLKKEAQTTISTPQEKTCNVTGSCCDAIKNCLCSCQEKSY